MKRTGNLYSHVLSFENLYKAYCKARKGCGKTEEAMCFSLHLEKKLMLLQKELSEQTYEPSGYRTFKIFDPKERIISVAPFRDRVVHHAIINMIEPLFEKTFIFHSYATRKKKGTHAAILQAQRFMKCNFWFMKMDISKYFDSIRHDILKKLIQKKIKDKRLLLVIDRIIDNGGTCGSGLPIGNLTSQFFANVYLNNFDHYVLEKLKPGGYIRYMDDFVLFSNNKEKLKIYREQIQRYLKEELNLQVKPKSIMINNRQNGLSFLGSRIFPSMLRIRHENLIRLIQHLTDKTSQFKQSKITEKSYVASLHSIIAHLKFFNSYRLRQSVFTGQPLS